MNGSSTQIFYNSPFWLIKNVLSDAPISLVIWHESHCMVLRDRAISTDFKVKENTVFPEASKKGNCD